MAPPDSVRSSAAQGPATGPSGGGTEGAAWLRRRGRGLVRAGAAGALVVAVVVAAGPAWAGPMMGC